VPIKEMSEEERWYTIEELGDLDAFFWCPTPAWQRPRRLAPGYCAYCGAFALLNNDHIVPRSREPRFAFVHRLANIARTCRPCNFSKRNMMLYEWVQSLPFDAPQRTLVPLRFAAYFFPLRAIEGVGVLQTLR
jgi:hypothetical protein